MFLKIHSGYFCAALISTTGPIISTNWICVGDLQLFPLEQWPCSKSKQIRPNNVALALTQIYKKKASLHRGLVNRTRLQLFIIHLVREYSLVACCWNRSHYACQRSHKARSSFTVDVLMLGHTFPLIALILFRAFGITRAYFLLFRKTDHWSVVWAGEADKVIVFFFFCACTCVQHKQWSDCSAEPEI